jgi:hypothetical protein
MEKRWIRLVFTLAMGSISLGAYSQQPTPSNTAAPTAAQPGAQIKVDSGTLIQVEMNSDVDAKKAHAGDIFRTRLWEALRNGDKVILPKNTIVVGHVVAAQPRTKDNPESRLTVTFDKAVLKDGSELPLHGVVARVQLSAMAAAAASANARSYNQGLSPGSTTNIAMPAQLPLPGEGGDQNQLATPGPTNIRDTNIIIEADASGTITVFRSAAKADVKLKHYATLDVQIAHIGN